MIDVMWFDGGLQDSRAIEIRPFSHALHYGSGVFEGIRAYPTSRGTAIFRLTDHVLRLFRSANSYGLQIDYDAPMLEEAISQTLCANDFSSAYIRPLVYFGEKDISLAPRFGCPTHVLVAVRPHNGSHVGTSSGARVCISSWMKTPSRALPSTVKACGHYTNSVLALHEAHEKGFDEALLLNERGEIAEGTGENLFTVKNGRLRTNAADADILEGITRDTVLQIARDLKVPVDIGPIRREDVFAADEIFLTGTAAEVLPVLQVDDHVLAQERPVTCELRRAYAEAVRGETPKYTGWLTFV